MIGESGLTIIELELQLELLLLVLLLRHAALERTVIFFVLFSHFHCRATTFVTRINIAQVNAHLSSVKL